MISDQFGDLLGANVSSDPDNFFQSDRDLELAKKRQEKQADKDAQKAGKPIVLPSKILAFVVVEPPHAHSSASLECLGASGEEGADNNPEARGETEDSGEGSDEYAYVADAGHVARKVNLKTGKVAKVFKGHAGPVTAVAVIYNSSGVDEFIVTGSWDKTIKKWDVKSKSAVHTYLGHTDFIKRILINGNHMYSASADTTIRKWDLSSGSSLLVFKDHGRSVEDLALSPDSTILFSASSDTTIKKWDASSGALLATLQGHLTSVYGLRLEWEEGVLWSASADCTVKRWDLERGESDTTLQHPDFCKCVQPIRGAYVATGSRDESVRIWDVATEKCIRVLDGHFGEISDMQLRGSLLWTVSLDGTIRRWSVAERDIKSGPKETPKPKVEPATPAVSAGGATSLIGGMTEEEERELAELMGDDEL
ncbi:hypothetical protein HK104_004713 [Borealophlyctis nickersoniae]|nr:hypothetical protein HK104_004713 [Borealophlyctis nickersoniae]